MSRETWERIIAHNKIDDVFSTGSVRITDGDQDDGPRLTAIGIRFDAKSIASAATKHGLMTAKAIDPPTPLESAPDQSTASPPSVTSRGIKRHVRIIPQGALQLTIDEVMAVLAVGRTTLYKLINDGTLEMKKTGGRSHVTMLSVRTYMER
ncbi:helix-turn-helix domain-containing protein [Sphingobium sp. 3R8]|uniref:helix-turn-helix domain-containing protein n=1 Tax=Sphingobium sp. 3R8 TaxID=2874921 RepID=UPI001CCC00C1|nr:helix-turn-helix domain-containing protein [Sphingobium sp. 3R8]MBZ9647072.1 helix-turn-helix domain-containing protein [Sphingobium sp. 3R8]